MKLKYKISLICFITVSIISFSKIYASSVSPTLPSNCITNGDIVTNFGSVAIPNFIVNGWCPDIHQQIYFITSATATSTSIVLFHISSAPNISNIQVAMPSPDCIVSQTGTFTTTGSPVTGFMLDCTKSDNPPMAGEILTYTILTSTTAK